MTDEAQPDPERPPTPPGLPEGGEWVEESHCGSRTWVFAVLVFPFVCCCPIDKRLVREAIKSLLVHIPYALLPDSEGFLVILAFACIAYLDIMSLAYSFLIFASEGMAAGGMGNQSVRVRSVGRVKINRSTNRINQSINQSTYHSINQSCNQSINHSIE